MDCPQGEKWPLKRGGHCREVAVVKKLKQDLVYGPYPPRKKNGRCKEVETRFSVWTVSAKKKMAVVKRLKQDLVYGPYQPRKKWPL